jgi:hypothetical protein
MGRKLFLSNPEDRSGEDTYRITVDTEDGPQVIRLVVSAGSLHLTHGDTSIRVALPEPDDELVEAAYDRCVEALPDTVTLYEVHPYDDGLSAELIQAAFAGDYEKLDEKLLDDDSYREARHDASWEAVGSYCDAADIDLLKQSSGDGQKMTELLWAVEERDDTDLVRALARVTGSVYVRYRLAHDVSTTWASTDDEKNNEALDIAGVLGIEGTDPAVSVIRQVLAEASSGGSLWLFWRGNVEELIDACMELDSTGNPVRQTMTVINPQLLVLGEVDGSGWAETIEADVTVDFDRAKLKVDAKGVGNGYSWSEDIVGGMTGGDAEVSFKPVGG